MIKCSIGQLGDLIITLYNNIINTGQYPKSWCEGYITPIFKSGDPLDPSNYRGITVSSCLGKLFTKIINTRLLQHLVDERIISNCQIGFIPGNRTADHILILKTLIDSYKKTKKRLFLCFVDFQKAFDTVFRAGLIYKLIDLNLSTKFIHIVKGMYNYVSASVRTEHGLTTKFPIDVGTRQGCNLSPTLFNLYINDLTKELLDPSYKPITLNETKLSCLMYADDLVLLSESELGMKKCLATLERFCCRWRLTVSTRKTKILIINQQRQHPYTFKILNTTLEVVKSYKYLGIIIDKKRNFSTAKDELCSKATRAYFSIKKHFNFYNNTTPKTLIKLYESMIQPILLYGSEIWGIFGWRKNEKESIKQYILNNKHTFEQLHSKICKNALGVHRNATDILVKAELGRLPLMANVIQYTYSYWQHIANASKDTLLYQLLVHMKTQHQKGQTNYYSRLHKLLSVLNSPCLIIKCNNRQSITNARRLRKTFGNIYEQYFFQTMEARANRTDSGGRFEIYNKIKRNYHTEKYLSMNNSKLRRCITNIRISTHCLPIEYLRKYNVDRKARLCSLCNKGQLGTEIHTLLHCDNTTVSQLRHELFQKLYEINTQFLKLSPENKLIYLLSAADANSNFYFSIFLDKVFKVVSASHQRKHTKKTKPK